MSFLLNSRKRLSVWRNAIALWDRILEALVDSLRENPIQGVDLGYGLRKLRMAISSKGKGKSGGARVITHTFIWEELKGVIKLLAIYDKSEYDSITDSELRELMRRNGLL